VLQSVAARDLDRARSLGPVGAVHDHYAGVLADPEVDAVYISLPNDGHAPWAILALEAGKHVLCEKPLGMTADEVRRIRDAETASGCLLVEATWNRWHPRTRRAEALIRAGVIGTVTAVDSGFVMNGVPDDNYRLEREHGGGALYDLGCYNVVASLWAAGSGDVEVVDAALRLTDGRVDLETVAHYRIGDVAVAITCAMDRDPAQWLRITGTDGSLDLPDDFVMSRNTTSRLLVETPHGPRVEEFAPCDSYTLMVENVSAAIRGDASYLPPAEESARMIDVVEKVFVAGGAPVDASS
jgi:predicted dehydrogenase